MYGFVSGTLLVMLFWELLTLIMCIIRMYCRTMFFIVTLENGHLIFFSCGLLGLTHFCSKFLTGHSRSCSFWHYCVGFVGLPLSQYAAVTTTTYTINGLHLKHRTFLSSLKKLKIKATDPGSNAEPQSQVLTECNTGADVLSRFHQPTRCGMHCDHYTLRGRWGHPTHTKIYWLI